MEKLMISKEWDRGYAFYTFKPKGYVNSFFERTSEMVGIGFDKKLGKWTAPATKESTDYLERVFGQDCLVWRNGPAMAPGAVGASRSFAPSCKPRGGKSERQPAKTKRPPVQCLHTGSRHCAGRRNS